MHVVAPPPQPLYHSHCGNGCQLPTRSQQTAELRGGGEVRRASNRLARPGCIVLHSTVFDLALKIEGKLRGINLHCNWPWRLSNLARIFSSVRRAHREFILGALQNGSLRVASCQQLPRLLASSRVVLACCYSLVALWCVAVTLALAEGGRATARTNQ